MTDEPAPTRRKPSGHVPEWLTRSKQAHTDDIGLLDLQAKLRQAARRIAKAQDKGQTPRQRDIDTVATIKAQITALEAERDG